MNIGNYEIIEKIANSECVNVYRATNIKSGQSNIIKMISGLNPTLSEISKLKYEYRITKDIHSKGIVNVIDFLEYDNRYFLVKEDFRGETLKEYINKVFRVKLIDFLEISIQLANIVNDIHSQNIIHKDINPLNILINPETKEVKITDFSISTSLESEAQLPLDSKNIEGTPSYISPEQTGRINRCIDNRSDLYSLGITLYEMIAGNLPFCSNDLLELVHSHLTVEAKKPHEIVPEIPFVISLLIMKLMSKDADDRYQSALGLLHDLNICFRELSVSGRVNNFSLAQKDQSNKLYIPQKIYGRDNELKILNSAFHSTIDNRSKLLFVSGLSGIGKTSLINETKRKVFSENGLFITGKFDFLQKNIPYYAFFDGFKTFLQSLLTENAKELVYWREALNASLYNSGKLIINQLPELELIIGPQPDVPLLDSSVSQNRFRKVFIEFINTFSNPKHPLVLFLDDIQWADIESIQLIDSYFNDQTHKNLLLIAAYRDNELEEKSVLEKYITKSKNSNYLAGNIHLSSLTLKATSDLVSDTFKIEKEHEELSKTLHVKSLGNPFYLKQLLRSLYEDKVIYYDFENLCWAWDSSHLHSINISDNSILDIVIRNLKTLPQAALEIIKLASCLGNQFSHSLLSIVTSNSAAEVAELMWPILQSGYVIPLSERYKMPLTFSQDFDEYSFDKNQNIKYQFAHDKIQQAAYSLISNTNVYDVHLDIGRKLFDNLPVNIQDDFIFDIVNQYNFGIPKISTVNEKKLLSKLNLSAGLKAKNSAAFVAAHKYFDFAISLLPDGTWLSNYNSTKQLYLLALESSYMAIDHQKAQKIFNDLLRYASDPQDIVQAYEYQISFYFTQNKPEKAINIAFEALNILGIRLPRNPNKYNVLISIYRVKLFQGRRKTQSLFELPIMEDKKQLSAMKILMSMIPATFVAQPSLYPVSVSKMVELSLVYGNSPLSIFAYNCFGLVFCGALNKTNIGYEYGSLALNLQELFKLEQYSSKTIFVFYVFVNPWVNHIQKSIDILPNGVSVGIKNGDIEYASHCASFYTIFLFLSGITIKNVSHEHDIYSKLLDTNKQEFQLIHSNIWRQVSENLSNDFNLTYESCKLNGNYFSEIKNLQEVLNSKNDLVISAYYLAKSFLSSIFNLYQESMLYSELANKHIKEVPGVIYLPISVFFNSFTHLKLYESSKKYSKYNVIRHVKANQSKLKKWSEQAPENFSQMYYLIQALLYSAQENIDGAIKCFEYAIELSRNNNYIYIQAISNEAYAEFLFKFRMGKAFEVYMREAFYLYDKWGAQAKTTQMGNKYSFLSEIPLKKSYSDSSLLTDSFSSTRQVDLDLASVFKTTQAISEEIVLSKLLKTIMNLLAENAGAQIGILFLIRDDKLLAVASTGLSSNITFDSAINPEESDISSSSALNYVSRTHNSLILENAQEHQIYSRDLYIKKNQVKSLLCLPLIKQGQLVGLAYFENNLATNIFRKDQLEVMNILSSQAAISLENAYLYDDLTVSRQREKAEREINELKSRFISMTSHEFRTPLTAILGTTELIKHYGQGWETEKQHSYLDRIQRNVKHMTGLLDDVLVLSKADVGKTEFNPVSIDLTVFCSSLVEEFQLNTKRGQKIEYVLEGKQTTCFSDEKILRQILSNLLSNAIKYSPESSIVCFTVTFSNDEVIFLIKDQGIGIPESDQPHLFESFQRATNVGQIQGTGLGLAIVKKSVELHQGTITFESTASQGTTFIVRLPITAESLGIESH